MFCIGLYARHTFRKVEPSEEKDPDARATIRKTEKAVQTESSGQECSRAADSARPGLFFGSATNVGYSSDSEDSLCRIEHAPLDGFHFPKQQHPSRLEASEQRAGDPSGIHLNHFTVRADINYHDSKDVTVVWPEHRKQMLIVSGQISVSLYVQISFVSFFSSCRRVRIGDLRVIFFLFKCEGLCFAICFQVWFYEALCVQRVQAELYE